MFLGSKDSERYLAPQENKEMITGLRFLYENYRTKTWYWEVIEMIRKVTLVKSFCLLSVDVLAMSLEVTRSVTLL